MAKSREKFKTQHTVFDHFANRAIFHMITQGYFKGLESPILIGKEANVFSARKESGELVIVKIYRLETCDFNKMYDYIKEDPRYIALKGKRRKIIFTWVQREYRNLLKAREAQVRVPKPLAFKDNILVMEYIGDDGVAPQLKNAPPKNPEKFLDEIIENMRKLYKAGLVHGDLSAFNILNFNEKPVFIDFSQCSPLTTSRMTEFLERDIKNCLHFFKKLGVVLDEAEVKKRITS
jgi:RIO kinase 1